MEPPAPDHPRRAPPAADGESATGGAPFNLPPRRVFVYLDGLVAVHAARAAHTALAAVPGVRTAEVTLAGAELEVEGVLDEEALRAALALVGVTVRVVEARPRRLPLLAEGEGAWG
ncbi:MAG: hypothetical protein KJT01_03615 [Gemmatimonadetes bacterium]|nr:hypothetical protein [Gemmatimonadota bacterium]